MPSNLFHDVPGGVKLLHIDIRNFKRKKEDMKIDDIFQNADIISLNETHLGHVNTLTPDMMGISKDMFIDHCDCNNRGGGVGLIVNTNLNPKQIRMNTILEIVVIEINEPIQMIVMSKYRPPSIPTDVFINHMLEIIAQFQHVPTCIVGNFNEDILNTSNTHCCTMIKLQGFQQMANKPTHNSGTIIYHVYVLQTVHQCKQISQTAITVIMIAFYVW